MSGKVKLLEVTLPIVLDADDETVQRLRYDAIRNWFVEVGNQRVRAADHPMVTLWSEPMVDAAGLEALHREWRAIGLPTLVPRRSRPEKATSSPPPLRPSGGRSVACRTRLAG